MARPPGGQPIYISRLSLLGFRNYAKLELELAPGIVLLQGGNAQGKSNLLEALYVLAIAKSYRATSERELVRHAPPGQPLQSQVAAEARRSDGSVRVQVDLTVEGSAHQDSDGAVGPLDDSSPVRKQVRVNGLRRRASDLVGEINAVIFEAGDLDIVLGAPSVRRRYMDILISQLDQAYLRALQRYQRVVTQRNYLLKSVREGRAQASELDFWDGELVEAGGYIVNRRRETVAALSGLAAPIHADLAGGETLAIAYDPSGGIAVDGPEKRIRDGLSGLLEERRPRDIGQGVTSGGPHRDDLRLTLGGLDAGLYASRGQSRTAALAMKLAEAAYLRSVRGEEPVLLLDDVFSELDERRRLHVLEAAAGYEQSFITTSDPGQIDRSFLDRMARFVVEAGTVRPTGPSSP